MWTILFEHTSLSSLVLNGYPRFHMLGSCQRTSAYIRFSSSFGLNDDVCSIKWKRRCLLFGKPNDGVLWLETPFPYISPPFSREVTKKKTLDIRSDFLRKRKYPWFVLSIRLLRLPARIADSLFYLYWRDGFYKTATFVLSSENDGVCSLKAKRLHFMTGNAFPIQNPKMKSILT